MSAPDNDGVTEPVRTVLLSARELGFLGPGPIERQLLHAQGFADLAKRQAHNTERPHLLDLGSGGGLPGLVLADQWPKATLVLLDANQRRTDFLLRALISCGLQDRVRVVQQRAEVAGRDPHLRAAFDGVVVRSFGPPSVVAECAAPFLREGGWLIVSEPPVEVPSPPETPADGIPGGVQGTTPDDSGRWPAQLLAQVGLTSVGSVRQEFGYQILRQSELCPERFPRRDGVPSRKPLF
jgi:16S rRNA (guanine527-N7)-methyltransferase